MIKKIIELKILIGVKISVFDIMGQEIRSLYKDDQHAGYHTLNWDAKNDKGDKVSTGMYFYILKAGRFKFIKKMVLLK